MFKQTEVEPKDTYFKMLIFIIKHKRVFKILFKYGDDRVVEDMVLEVKASIASACHLPKNSDLMFKIYAKEVAGVIEDWSEKDFPEDKIDHILKDIIYLTTTMRQRLSPIRE